MASKFFERLSRMGELPRFVLSRCLLLALTALMGALVLALWAGAGRADPYLAGAYASSLCSGALILFGSGLIGSALLEEALTH